MVIVVLVPLATWRNRDVRGLPLAAEPKSTFLELISRR
jgi:hypothetical protein